METFDSLQIPMDVAVCRIAAAMVLPADALRSGTIERTRALLLEMDVPPLLGMLDATQPSHSSAS